MQFCLAVYVSYDKLSHWTVMKIVNMAEFTQFSIFNYLHKDIAGLEGDGVIRSATHLQE